MAVLSNSRQRYHLNTYWPQTPVRHQRVPAVNLWTAVVQKPYFNSHWAKLSLSWLRPMLKGLPSNQYSSARLLPVPSGCRRILEYKVFQKAYKYVMPFPRCMAAPQARITKVLARPTGAAGFPPMEGSRSPPCAAVL